MEIKSNIKIATLRFLLVLKKLGNISALRYESYNFTCRPAGQWTENIFLTGECTLCPDGSDGSLEHLLLLCPSLAQCREQQLQMLKNSPAISDKAKNIIFAASVNSVSHFVQLLLDCSVIPEVIVTSQEGHKNILDEIFKFTRTWCFNIHMRRMKILGRWTK